MDVETSVLLVSHTCEIIQVYKDGYSKVVMTIVKNSHIISFNIHDGFDIWSYDLEKILKDKFPTVSSEWYVKAIVNIYDKQMTDFAILDTSREVK